MRDNQQEANKLLLESWLNEVLDSGPRNGVSRTPTTKGYTAATKHGLSSYGAQHEGPLKTKKSQNFIVINQICIPSFIHATIRPLVLPHSLLSLLPPLSLPPSLSPSLIIHSLPTPILPSLHL